jgi:hypothetical protein
MLRGEFVGSFFWQQELSRGIMTSQKNSQEQTSRRAGELVEQGYH